MTRRPVALTLVAGVGWIASIAGAMGQDRFPESDGKPQVMRVCSGCHDAEIILANLKTPGEWKETLQTMAEQGAEATPEEWRAIERYIDTNFALIPINKATADELQLTMDVTAEVAAAVVRQRQENGSFKSIDDVKKVAGVDAAKVDARKSRFVF
jgi:competence protein ComEA